MLEQNTQVLTVSQLNQDVHMLLKEAYSIICVEGEISNLSTPSSGHIYFSLKDQNAQVRCAMFRMSRSRMSFKPEAGMHVIVQAKPALYEARGDFQLIINSMQPAGEGALQLAFEQLKRKLDKEGLFANEYKLALPEAAKTIGVITSSTGAALHDILSILKRRAPHMQVIIYPSLVQGDTAPTSIVKQIKTANRRNEVDVLIVGRGGGSLEDLWCFNDEKVAHAIFKSKLPIISAVGHEVDITISDLVADVRAATPSAAAEIISQHSMQWDITLVHLKERLIGGMYTLIDDCAHTLTTLRHRLQHPGQRLQMLAQRVDDFEKRLHSHMQFHIVRAKQQLANTTRALNAVSPLNTLQRGYAIVTHNEHVVRKASDVKKGDKIKIRLTEDTLTATV